MFETKRKISPASAFTLVELLIYVAIFAVTSGTLTAILLTTTRIQNNEVAGIQVTQELNLVLETTQRLVRDASLIEKVYEGVTETAPCTTFCSVKLRMQNTALDPTVIRSTATAIYLKQGVNPETTITSNRVIVNSLNFTKFDIIGGHATIQIDASLTYNSTNPQLAITKTLRSAVGRVSAATFDSDLLPDATTSNRNIGAATNLWQNLSISKL
ncbi:MAG: prepilin-type N-terminal cleavage/methylation domain-containing protein, partial [Candidatus Colwellbacteria bacterium]|nr:prepilin-type N-terminal cleavage/methylation domain-containing protein [Candidatus Colwellbacteria bacterium]